MINEGRQIRWSSGMIASFGALDPSSFPTRDMLQIFQKIGVVFKETSKIQPWEIALERMTSQMEKMINWQQNMQTQIYFAPKVKCNSKEQYQSKCKYKVAG